MLGCLQEYATLPGHDLIMVDTGSTDNTVEMAIKHGFNVTSVGARFVEHLTQEETSQLNRDYIIADDPPIDFTQDGIFHFANARNFAASLAQHNYVFMPDCDEELDPFVIAEVIEAVKTGVGEITCDYIWSRNQHGKPDVFFERSRFYDRQQMRWEGMIHEALFWNTSGITKHLPSSVLKINHHQIGDNIRSTRDLKGLLLDCKKNPNNDRNAHYCGRQLLWCGRPRSAIKQLTAHINMSKWDAERAQSWIYIGEAYKQLNLPVNEYDAYQNAIKLDPNRRTPWLKMSEYHHRYNRPQLCACYASAALAIRKRSGFYMERESEYTYEPHDLLYWAHWNLGNKMEAKHHWQQAKESDPNNPRYIHDARFFD